MGSHLHSLIFFIQLSTFRCAICSESCRNSVCECCECVAMLFFDCQPWNLKITKISISFKYLGRVMKFASTFKMHVRGGADKSLARPWRKQATVTKLGIYSTYSPRSSIHFLARCSNFCKTLKKKSEGCPSNQVSAAAMTSASDEKWRLFNCFFSV